MADCFLKLDQINGESGDQEFKGFIQVTGWTWGVSWRPGQAHHTRGPGGGSARTLEFTHVVDLASPALLSRCLRGILVPTGKLVMRRAGGTAQKYLTIKIERIRITDVSLVHDTENVIPLERVALAFEQIDYEYTPQGSSGGAGSGGASFDWRIDAGA